MLKLNVPDMTCGHCAATVTKAVRSVDDAAVVDIDLPAKAVSIRTNAEPAKISAALEAAGYASTVL